MREASIVQERSGATTTVWSQPCPFGRTCRITLRHIKKTPHRRPSLGQYQPARRCPRVTMTRTRPRRHGADRNLVGTRCVPLMLVAACFQPKYDHPTCGAGEACPGDLVCIDHVVCGEPSSPPGTWSIASADFTAPGYSIANMTIEPNG